MKCPKCKIKMKLMNDTMLNEKYYHCETCKAEILKSIAKMKIKEYPTY